MSYEDIRFEIADGVARLTLHRPDKLNSFTDAMHGEVRRALDELDRAIDARQARVLVLTGAGRGFCAGQDLNDRSVSGGNAPPDLGASVEKNYKPLVLRLQNLRVPTLAAVNGIAAGAGASLALACDLVVATRSASFLQAFSKIGLIPDTGGTWFLPHRLGMARALGLALLAEKLPAEQAADWGLIWACVDDADFAASIDRLARQLAEAPTRALVATRQAMRSAHTHTLERHLDLEAAYMRDLGTSRDYREGVAAFMEKRPAKFTGE